MKRLSIHASNPHFSKIRKYLGIFTADIDKSLKVVYHSNRIHHDFSVHVSTILEPNNEIYPHVNRIIGKENTVISSCSRLLETLRTVNPTEVKMINFGGISLGFKGIERLYLILSNNDFSSLKSLDLSLCDIGYEGAIYISRLIRENTLKSLEVLKINYNPFQWEGFEAILGSLIKNKTITTFEMGLIPDPPVLTREKYYNTITAPNEYSGKKIPEILKIIIHVLTHNNILTELNVGINFKKYLISNGLIS